MTVNKRLNTEFAQSSANPGTLPTWNRIQDETGCQNSSPQADRCIDGSHADTLPGYHRQEVYWLICHLWSELLVMTKTTRSSIQETEIGFLCVVSELSLSDGVRSSEIQMKMLRGAS